MRARRGAQRSQERAIRGIFLRSGFLDAARQVKGGAHLVRQDKGLAIKPFDDSGVYVARVLHGDFG
jgi:hypothetical protein